MTAAMSHQPERKTFAPDALLCSQTGAMLHIASCPHVGSVLREATKEERLSMEVCSWCRAELDGVGRTYCATLEAAMRIFGTHAGTERQIREALRFVAHDQIWLPHSRSYVALGLEGRAVAWFGKTYVAPDRDTFIELPDYAAGSGGGSPRHDQLGDTCPVHHIATALTGACDLCD